VEIASVALYSTIDDARRCERALRSQRRGFLHGALSQQTLADTAVKGLRHVRVTECEYRR